MDLLPETRDRSAEVCDQCRKRKVKCDGILPACSNCAQSQSNCAFSAQLKRKTKRRGHDPKDQTIQNLQAEIASLRHQLKSQPQGLHSQSPGADASIPTATPQTTSLSRYQQATARRATKETARQFEKASGPVFRHLGRLVCPDDGVDQFAGSSTGVHFTLSAQTTYQVLLSSKENFPEAVFSLYLLSWYPGKGEKAGSRRRSPGPTLHSVFSQPKSFYMGELNRFFATWSYLYPILARKQFFDGVDRIFVAIGRQQEEYSSGDEIILYQLLIVLAISSCDNTNNNETSMKYHELSLDLYHHVTANGSLASLQGLLLLLLYYQVTWQHHLVCSTIGSVVRVTHSLGLHRHARRFRFCVGETEVRKRVWWCVYIFDVMTSLHYGLPKLINNEDDDNDLPADCDFDDITLTQLPLPFPGESTKMSPFLCYIKLAKILSAILKELYTTTRRRNGVQKIEQLTRELQVWDSLSEITIGRFSDVDQDYYGQNRDGDGRDAMSLWLHLLSQMALIYIHRPALTFEPSEPQFQTSLRMCSKASENVISLLDMFHGDEKLRRMFPSGPNIIFQCALLCLYRAWHTLPSTNASPLSYIQNDERWIGPSPAVETAASLLDTLNKTGLSQSVSAQEFSAKTAPLLQASWVLRHLLTATAQCVATSTESPHSVISTTSNSISAFPCVPPSNTSRSHFGDLEQMQFASEPIRLSSSHNTELGVGGGHGSETSPDFLFGNENGLEYLNQMDDSTWTFLSQLGGYSGEINTDGLVNYS